MEATKTEYLTRNKFIKMLKDGQRVFDGIKFKWGTHLCNLPLEGISIRNGEFFGTCLYSTNLRGARIEGTSFQSAYMAKVDLSGATIRKSGFSHANMEGSILKNARILGSTMCMTELFGAKDIGSCDVNGTYFMDAKVSASQKRSVLGKYRLIKEAARSRRTLSKAPYISTLKDNEPFRTVTMKLEKRKD